MRLLRELKKAALSQKTFADYLMKLPLDNSSEIIDLSKEKNSLPPYPDKWNSPYIKFLNLFTRRGSFLIENDKLENNKEHLRNHMEIAKKHLGILASFYKNGQKVIRFKNQSLIHQLENTDINKLNFSDIKLPFKHFYIDISNKLDGSYIDGVFVCDHGEQINLICLQRDDFDGHMTMNIILEKSESITSSIENSISHYIKEFAELIGYTVDTQRDDTKKDIIEQTRKYYKILGFIGKLSLNSIVLYNMVKDNNDNKTCFVEKSDTTLKKPPSLINKKNISYVSDANYSYILTNKSDKNQKIEEASKSQRIIEKQFIVSGHYRKQPIGSRDNTNHKIIWIEPYIKGVEFEKDTKLKIKVI